MRFSRVRFIASVGLTLVLNQLRVGIATAANPKLALVDPFGPGTGWKVGRKIFRVVGTESKPIRYYFQYFRGSDGDGFILAQREGGMAQAIGLHDPPNNGALARSKALLRKGDLELVEWDVWGSIHFRYGHERYFPESYLRLNFHGTRCGDRLCGLTPGVENQAREISWLADLTGTRFIVPDSCNIARYSRDLVRELRELRTLQGRSRQLLHVYAPRKDLLKVGPFVWTEGWLDGPYPEEIINHLVQVSVK